jgi:hypothetical protein
VLRESGYQAGTLVRSDEGWDVVGATYIDRDEERPYGREDYHVDIPEQENMIWDPDSKTMVPAFENNEPHTRSRPDNWGFNDQMTFKPKNPEMEGIYANDVETDPFFKRDPRPGDNHDDSFPSMISNRIRPVKGSMKNFTSVDDERHYEANNPPNLDECPECGDPMIDDKEHTSAQCHACGHKQPIIYNHSKKNASGWYDADDSARDEARMDHYDEQRDIAAGERDFDDDGQINHAIVMDNGDHRLMIHNKSEDTTHDRRSMDEIRDDLSRQGLKQIGTFADNVETWSRHSAHGDDNNDVGIAVDIKGTDVIPDAGNQGFTEDVGDSPELLKDVNDVGGTTDHHGLDQLMDLMNLGDSEDQIKTVMQDYMKNHMEHKREHKSSKWYKVAARRPKMCPFHTDLVDYSLALGNPETALRSLGTLMYSPSSCKGGHELVNKNGNPTKCRFKPEMVTPSYWEAKEAEDEARRQQREEREALQAEQINQESEQVVQEPQAELDSQTPVLEQEAPAPAEVTRPDENTTVVPAELINQLQQGDAVAPPIDAIELPTDYDPEAYWEEGDDAAREQYEQAQQTPQVETPAPVAPMPQAVAPGAFAMAARKLADSMGGPTMMPDPPSMGDGPTHGPMDTLDVADEPKPDQSHVADMDGHPLVAGAVYDMYNQGVDQLPETIHITKVEPYFIEFEIQNDEFGMGYNGRVSTQDIDTQNIQFKTHDGSPNADGKPTGEGAEQNNDDNTHAYDGMGTDDLSTGRSAAVGFGLNGPVDPAIMTPVDPLGSDHGPLDPKLAWLMEGEDDETDEMMRVAGRNFALHEQRDLINEPGDARNLDKLDLAGTHYPDTTASDDDELLFY